MNQIHLDIIITGKVQGVGFRAGALHKAKTLGLYGFAQNNDDGSVRIAVEGESESVDMFLDWCREGPMLAAVDAVEVKPGAMAHYTEFSISKNYINLLE
jgi:acylphosphatase